MGKQPSALLVHLKQAGGPPDRAGRVSRTVDSVSLLEADHAGGIAVVEEVRVRETIQFSTAADAIVER